MSGVQIFSGGGGLRNFRVRVEKFSGGGRVEKFSGGGGEKFFWGGGWLRNFWGGGLRIFR